MFPFCFHRGRKPQVWFGATSEDLPNKEIDILDRSVFASYTGPDSGLRVVHDLENGNTVTDNKNNGKKFLEADNL